MTVGMNDSEMAEMPPRSEFEKEAYTLVEQFTEMYGRTPEAVSFAPGRIEIIGNHTDYNGGRVIGAAIDLGVFVAGATRSDARARLCSTQLGTAPVELDLARGSIERQRGAGAWANYPLGVLDAIRHYDLRTPSGFDYLVTSTLPAGSGLSSSAAIELSSALVFLQLAGQRCSTLRLAEIGRHAENKFVGVPSGILDQGVSAHGCEGQVVLIDCTALTFETLPLPAGLRFWVFNTHTKHALVDGLYAERHRECQAAAAGLGIRQLADISVEQLTRAVGRLSPTLFARATHVVEEIARVQATVCALRAGRREELGRLLTDSHQSSRRHFMNSARELDFLVDELVALPGVLGARLTGGGFGGAVLALTTPSFKSAAADALSRIYADRFSGQLDVRSLHATKGARLMVL